MSPARHSCSLMAEFPGAAQLVDAARRVRSAGFRRLEAFAPFEIEGLDEVLHPEPRRWRVPFIMLLFGAIGGCSALYVQWYLSVVDYPLNAGGKPFFSWPPFALLAFEFTVLGAAVSGFVSMLGLNGLPRLYDPVFAAPGFERASQDRFFLRVGLDDPDRELPAARELLQSLKPLRVEELTDGE